MCNGVGIAASTVLGCPGPTEQSSTEVRDGIHEGRPAVVLLTTGAIGGEDSTYTFTRRLYLDAQTYLPLALDEDGQVDAGQVTPARVHVRFHHRFVPLDAVARDLFDPASLGYSAARAVQALDRPPADMHVYWLGDEFAGRAGLPALVLSKTDAPDHGPGYRYLLQYTARDDRYGPTLATLQVWPRTVWDAVPPPASFDYRVEPCWAREEITVPNGAAVIFSGFRATAAPSPPGGTSSACPSGSREIFLAEVYFADTVILLNAPAVIGVGGVARSPFNSREGIEVLVRGLGQR